MSDGTLQPGLPDELTQRAAAFERDWLTRATELDRQRDRRNRRVQRQFWFLFAFLLAAFILLAYRTETNASEIRIGFWQECVDRQNRILQSNDGREAFIRIVITNPDRPVPPERVEAVTEQLRQALLLPQEDCGPDPSQ